MQRSRSGSLGHKGPVPAPALEAAGAQERLCWLSLPSPPEPPSPLSLLPPSFSCLPFSPPLCFSPTPLVPSAVIAGLVPSGGLEWVSLISPGPGV